MYLTGLTHRDELFDLTVRWLNDDFHEGDGRLITEIFLYEGFISGSFVIDRMFQFLRKIFGANLEMERIRQKQLLRERLIQYTAHRTGRTEDLVLKFRENPEFFFPRLSIDAVLVVASGKRLVSIGRIKRLSRVAEKVSFRLMDALFQDIKAEARRGFPAYLERGSRTIRMEIILTTYPELMESEFGRSLHELRILQLRERTPYCGLIAQNAGYLIEYLLTLAMSPVVDVPELPIKLYGRYLPETIAAVKCALFGNDIDGSLLNAFCLLSGCTEGFCLLTS